MACEWIPWIARDWRELNGEKLSVEFQSGGLVLSGPRGVEASFYMTEHDPVRQLSLQLAYDGRTRFMAAMNAVVDFHGYAGGDADPNLRVVAKSEVRYLGLIVVKDNFRPKPTTKARAMALAERFVDLQTYRDPADEGWRWVFRPKAFRKKL
jgi:hypothetical protein